MPVHRIPVAEWEREKQALDCCVEQGVIVKINEPTTWCSNELIRETPKKFRFCLDPSQTVNKAIHHLKHQMPTLNEHLYKLSAAKCFSIADVKDSFLHISLDEESSWMTTMHTSYGRYRWLCLPFGITSAPEEFQMRLTTAPEGIICVADDILVCIWRRKRLWRSSKRPQQKIHCSDGTLSPKEHQAQCGETSVQAQGTQIHGHHYFRSSNETWWSWLGHSNNTDAASREQACTPMLHWHGQLSVTLLSPFCENLSSVIQQEAVTFIWSEVQESAFSKAKQLISSAPVLAYYYLHKPVVLQTDASDYALGSALLQPNDKGKLQPVAFTSSSMSPTEQCYSQIEKECLAICNCFQKFDQWLYGKSDIVVHTDHQPPETIMKKPLNKAPARLQRMLMKLQRYRFDLTYKRGTTLHLADTLSRAALPQPT